MKGTSVGRQAKTSPRGRSWIASQRSGISRIFCPYFRILALVDAQRTPSAIVPGGIFLSRSYSGCQTDQDLERKSKCYQRRGRRDCRGLSTARAPSTSRVSARGLDRDRGSAAAVPGYARKAPPLQLAGVSCEIPPPLHCPAADCPGPTVVAHGTAVEPKTGRNFFLDYPRDLKRGEKVTFVLSLHGFGSYGNWQRHYFPSWTTRKSIAWSSPRRMPQPNFGRLPMTSTCTTSSVSSSSRSARRTSRPFGWLATLKAA